MGSSQTSWACKYVSCVIVYICIHCIDKQILMCLGYPRFSKIKTWYRQSSDNWKWRLNIYFCIFVQQYQSFPVVTFYKQTLIHDIGLEFITTVLISHNWWPHFKWIAVLFLQHMFCRFVGKLYFLLSTFMIYM